MDIYGKGMSPRKVMASSKGDSFGIKAMPGGKPHPDVSGGTGEDRGKRMGDSSRGIGAPISGGKARMPAQAAPDHGPHFPGGAAGSSV